jgi:hypothetical protein
MPSTGIVYVADRTFGELLLASLHSLYSSTRALPSITVFTLDFDFSDLRWEPPSGRLNTVRLPQVVHGVDLGTHADRRHRLARALVLAQLSEYDLTLSLDSDTMVCADVSPVFDLLIDSGCSVAGVPEHHDSELEPFEFFFGGIGTADPAVTIARASTYLGVSTANCRHVPYFNGGILCVRKGRWAERWLDLLLRTGQYPDVNPCDDQLPLQAALGDTRTPTLILNSAWNCSHRTTHSGTAMKQTDGRWMVKDSDGSSGPMRILHGIAAIHWMKFLTRFPPNIDYARHVATFQGVRRVET